MLRPLFAFIFVALTPAFAQPINPWKDVDENAMLATAARNGNVEARRNIVPQKYRALELNRPALESVLATAPKELSVATAEVSVPLPDGSYGRFSIQESPIMEPALAKKFPEIKTYVGQGIDDPAAVVRMDMTPSGFHAQILSPNGDVFIDPYWRDSDTNYVAYRKADYVADKPFSCLTDVEKEMAEKGLEAVDLNAPPTGATLRKFRLALACTGEYAVAVCSPNPPSVPRTLAAMVTSVNRVSGVYERDVAIRLILVANTELLIYLDGNTDPYTNNDGEVMLGQNQTNVNNVIGSANYDIGHVFSTGGGGIASLGVPCGSSKAQGVTGTSNPKGDPYDIDYVAHEMGHQFNGPHTFNSTVGSCSGNRTASSAYEVGSGVTIMAYAGICGNTNIAPNSDDYFHTGSFTRIDTYVTTGNGASCVATSPTGNNPPTISPLSSYTIPANTAFALTGAGADVDGDTLTYAWEEFDTGSSQTTQNPSSTGTNPVFRPIAPSTSPTRYFPSLTYILNNANVPPATNADGFATGEVLPTIARTMNFRLTVRDNRAGGGGSNWAANTVTTVVTGASFAVTSPNTATSFAGGSQQTVTWNVAGSDTGTINCANVKISLSTDGGYTFPTVLAASTPNNGSALVTIPQIATTQGRIKVEAIGNIFFDISDANFTITSTNTAPTINIANGITVSRGKPVATVATVGTVNDANGDTMTVSVSNLPYRASVTPSLVGNSISLSALVDCTLTTTLSSRTYPITLTVTDSNGASTSAIVNLIVTPNDSPTLGNYPNRGIAQNTVLAVTPTAAVADANGNLPASPYTISPTTLPGGGTIAIDQSNGVVTVTTTASTTLNSVTNVRVTATDSCGATAISDFKVSIYNTPVLQANAVSGPSSESCSPVNGVPDPGETLTVALPVENIGGVGTTNLVATLQTSGGVTPITTSQNYGALAANSSATRSFQFTAGGSCGGVITLTLQLQDGATNFGTVTYTMQTGILTPTTTSSENFDGVTAPALPAGWTSAVATGSGTNWVTSTTTPDSSPNDVTATPIASTTDIRLTSPSIAIPSALPRISFRQRYNIEGGYDGGILEISINGGAFTDIIAAGGTFISGGYSGQISAVDGSLIAGADAWTGSANTAYTTTLINLPPSAAGQNAQFRWRLVCDSTVTPTGSIWRIDNVVITSNSYVCASCSASPSITSMPPASPLVVGSFYSHTFTATGSPTPTFSLTNGMLPMGLSLSVGGVLSGTPTSAGTGTFPGITVTASNGNPPNASETFTLNVVTIATNYLSGFGLTGANAAFTFDYDLDGLLNLMEYALGLNPTTAYTGGLPVVTLKNYSGTNYLSMTFTRSSVATDLTYIVQGSNNLTTWADLATNVGGGATTGAGFVGETGSAPNFIVEVRDTVALGATPRYLRLKITSP